MIRWKKPATLGPEERSEYLRKPWRSATQRLVPVLLGAAVIFSCLSLLLGNRGVAQLWELAWRQRELRTELTALERDAENLKWELGETGSMAIERPAREKFHMQRPGEIVYYFPRESTAGTSTYSTNDESTSEPDDSSESR
ncbi:MAG: septum formation initiator family protein [Candidatus Eisenbacteria bacterium]